MVTFITWCVSDEESDKVHHGGADNRFLCTRKLAAERRIYLNSIGFDIDWLP
jgi:hypothetical protein